MKRHPFIVKLFGIEVSNERLMRFVCLFFGLRMFEDV